MHASSLLSISLASFTVIESIGLVATVDPNNEEGQPKWQLKDHYRRIEALRAKTKDGCYTGEFMFKTIISDANPEHCKIACKSLAKAVITRLTKGSRAVNVARNACMAQSKVFETLHSAEPIQSEANHGCQQCACEYNLTLSSIFRAIPGAHSNGVTSPKYCDLEGVGKWLEAFVGDAQPAGAQETGQDKLCEAFQTQWPKRRCIDGKCETMGPEGQWIEDKKTKCCVQKGKEKSEVQAKSQKPKKQKTCHEKQKTCSTRRSAIDESTTCSASAAPVDRGQSSSAAARTEAQNRLSEEEAFLSDLQLQGFFNFDDPNFDF